jgi:hypothetical protein
VPQVQYRSAAFELSTSAQVLCALPPMLGWLPHSLRSHTARNSSAIPPRSLTHIVSIDFCGAVCEFQIFLTPPLAPEPPRLLFSTPPKRVLSELIKHASVDPADKKACKRAGASVLVGVHSSQCCPLLTVLPPSSQCWLPPHSAGCPLTVLAAPLTVLAAPSK